MAMGAGQTCTLCTGMPISSPVNSAAKAVLSGDASQQNDSGWCNELWHGMWCHSSLSTVNCAQAALAAGLYRVVPSSQQLAHLLCGLKLEL